MRFVFVILLVFRMCFVFFLSQSRFLRVCGLLAFSGHNVQTLTLYIHRNDDKEGRGQSVEAFSLRDAAKSHAVTTYWVCYRYIFLPRDAMLARYYAIAYGPISASLYMCVSATSRSIYTKTAGRRITLTVRQNSPESLVF